MKLKNKVAIVTGGSGGIGATIVEFFCREGARVAILDISRKAVETCVRETERQTGVRPLGFVCDVTNDAAVRRTVAKVAKKLRRIDVVVNCAGVQQPIGEFTANIMKDWERNIAVNLFGTVHVCHAVIPFMKKAGGGSIVNFSGGGATSSRPNFSAYAVAKTGVVKLTEILAEELVPRHIRVNAIAPGAVNTNMLKEVLRMGDRAGRQEIAGARKRAKEGGTSPEVAASLVVFLASKDSEGLTGRLISAPWDDWKTWDKKKIKEIMATDKFTLRRTK